MPWLALVLRRKVWQRSWLSPPRFLQVSATLPPSTHHVSSSLPAYIELILFPYCFRIVSASGSENDRRTIGERYGIDTGSIRDQYVIDTRPIRNGLFRLPTEDVDKKFNFFVIVSFDYILHFNHSTHPAIHVIDGWLANCHGAATIQK